MSTRNRGEATLIVLAVVAGAGLVVWLGGTKLFYGDSRRAKQSQEATVRIERAAEQVDAAAQKQAATAAASVVEIGRAAATAPASPEKEFIVREVPVALANLPAPDAAALLEAERRRVAVMEGRVEEVSRLYGEAAKRNEQLSAEVAAARSERDAALAERRAIDAKLAEVAAQRLGAQRVQLALAALVVLALAGWAYAKFFGISPATLGRIAAEVRAGVNPIAAMDTHLAPWTQRAVRKHAQLATDLDKDGNGIPDSEETAN